MVKALLAALIAATLVNSPLAAQEYLEGYIMLSLRNELPHPVRGLSSGGFASGLSSLDNILARHRTEVFKRFSGFTAYGRRLYKLKVPSTVNIESVLQDLRNNPNVEHAERIEILKTLLTPNDTDWANQWNFDDDHLHVVAYSAGCDHVIGVTGVLQNDQKGRDTGYGAYVDVAAPVDNVPTVAYDANPTRPSMRTPAETRPDSWPHIHVTKNLEIFGRYL